jgi:hypothetical protein
MGMMAAKLSGKGKFGLCIIMASIFCCFIPAAQAATAPVQGSNLIYSAVSLQLNITFGFSPGTFQLVKGPFSVAAYSQLRFYASVSSGAPVTVSITATDSTGKNIYGLLDSFTLNPGTTAGSSATKVYDSPGQWVTVTFTYSQASIINTALFGYLP